METALHSEAEPVIFRRASAPRRRSLGRSLWSSSREEKNQTCSALSRPQGLINAHEANVLVALGSLLLLAFPRDLASQPPSSGLNAGTPPAMAGGAPAGSYSLTGLEHANLYN